MYTDLRLHMSNVFHNLVCRHGAVTTHMRMNEFMEAGTCTRLSLCGRTSRDA